MPRTRFARILRSLRKQGYEDKDLKLVRHAYTYAVSAHQEQKRLSGEPYVLHSLWVGLILASVGLDPVTVSAGILHDILEDTRHDEKDLRNEFGEEITCLVDGVTKIRRIGIPEQEESLELKQAQNIRKLLVATAQDVRVILIKLADRLHNMRTIDVLPEERRKRIARETLDIYTPIADRLGISAWKWELEDLAFRQLRPSKYEQIKTHIAMKRRAREAQLAETCRELEGRLAEAGIEAHVIGRPKHLYSIYKKMRDQGKSFEEVLDIEALRVITRTPRECYGALGIVHNLWPPIPGRFKDYLSIPKYNMYQSIHTSVMRNTGRPMEIQIRSEEMDRIAREGIAAHWIYKEGARDKRLDTQLSWLRTLFEWLQDAASTEEIMESVVRDFTPSHLYVFTPKGAVKELPRGATPLDFAYAVHSAVGNHCVGAQVNGRMVPLRYHLQNGDVVEILTAKNKNPSRDWLDVVVTGKARARIRQRLREIGTLDPVPPEKKHEEPQRSAKTAPAPPKNKGDVPAFDEATRQKLIRVDGGKGLAVSFGKCCDPMPGEEVVAYVTLNPAGVTIHRKDCKAFRKSNRDQSRIYSAFWEGEGQVIAGLRVIISQRPNVLFDIMEALRPMTINILEARFSPEPGNGKCRFDFLCELAEDSAVEQVKRLLRAVPDVAAIKTLKPNYFKQTEEE
ncbi:MAG: RelA/SpoT family protein [Candidatus Hydrogenedentota bacterium]